MKKIQQNIYNNIIFSRKNTHFNVLFQSDSPSGASLNALGVHLLVSLFFVIGTMIEFAIVLLINRKLVLNGPQCPCIKKGICKIRNLRKRNPLFIFRKNPVDPKDRNSSPSLEKEQTPNSQEKPYSTTDKIDITALCVFLLSYIMFNFVYMIHYM